MSRVQGIGDKLSAVNKKYDLDLHRGDVITIGERQAIVHGAVDWWIRVRYAGNRRFDYIDPTAVYMAVRKYMEDK